MKESFGWITVEKFRYRNKTCFIRSSVKGDKWVGYMLSKSRPISAGTSNPTSHEEAKSQLIEDIDRQFRNTKEAAK